MVFFPFWIDSTGAALAEPSGRNISFRQLILDIFKEKDGELGQGTERVPSWRANLANEPSMPKVKHYSAAWLSKNAPGNQLFEPSADSLRSKALSSPSKKKQTPGPRRTIARRGTEVFVAVGKEIRWGDLVYLKEEWMEKQSRRRRSSSVRVKQEDDTLQSIELEPSEMAAGWRVS